MTVDKKISGLRQLLFVVREVVALLTKADKQALFVLVLLNVFIGVSIIPATYLDKLFLDTLISSISSPQNSDAIRIILIVIGTRLALNVARGISRRWVGYFNNRLSRKFVFLLDSEIGRKYSSIGIQYIEDPKFKDKISRIEKEGGNRAFNLVGLIADLPRNISGIFSSLLIFGIFHPYVAIFSLLVQVPTLIFDALGTKKGYLIDEQMQPLQRIWGMVNYYLSRSKTYLEIRLLGISETLIKKLEEVANKINIARLGFRKERVEQNNILGTIEDVFSHIFDAYFAVLAINRTISIGTAQAYLRAISQFRTSITELNGGIVQLYENYLYVNDLVWFLNLKLPTNLNSGIDFPGENNIKIEFRNISFKYPDTNKDILSNISFTVNPKENISIVGENGVGKTTLVKLLCGFYEPTQGKILINDIEIHRYKLTSLWQNFGVMFQDYEGYDFSPRENIGFGNTDDLNNDRKIQDYAKFVDLNDWIESLPTKYNNPLSKWVEGGVIPSGGQWQRMAIARTLFREAKVVILDEPTSNVDAKAEEEIFQKLLKYGEEKNLIFISHRFSTVRRADKIIVLDKGTIIEQGTHEQLMKLKGKYAHLFNLQAKSYQ